MTNPLPTHLTPNQQLSLHSALKVAALESKLEARMIHNLPATTPAQDVAPITTVLIVSPAGGEVSTNSLLSIGQRLISEHAPAPLQVEIRRLNATPGNSIVVKLSRTASGRIEEAWSVEPYLPQCPPNTTKGS